LSIIETTFNYDLLTIDDLVPVSLREFREAEISFAVLSKINIFAISFISFEHREVIGVPKQERNGEGGHDKWKEDETSPD